MNGYGSRCDKAFVLICTMLRSICTNPYGQLGIGRVTFGHIMRSGKGIVLAPTINEESSPFKGFHMTRVMITAINITFVACSRTPYSSSFKIMWF